MQKGYPKPEEGFEQGLWNRERRNPLAGRGERQTLHIQRPTVDSTPARDKPLGCGFRVNV